MFPVFFCVCYVDGGGRRWGEVGSVSCEVFVRGARSAFVLIQKKKQGPIRKKRKDGREREYARSSVALERRRTGLPTTLCRGGNSPGLLWVREVTRLKPGICAGGGGGAAGTRLGR